MSDFQGLKNIAASYLRGVELTPLERAYAFAAERHQGQRHISGEPYFEHLVAVATTLAAMKLDLSTIMAGLLHGTLKENVATAEEIAQRFGPDVAQLVEGSTRITNVHYNNQLAHQAGNLRKLLVAMSTDVRVLLLKLADRLQDMVTIGTAPEEHRRQVAQETIDLYAPLASRLGIDWMKRELEDSAFQYLFPVEYAELTSGLDNTLDERQRYVDEVIGILYRKLAENNIQALRIIGRPKHLYSIYKKLVVQNIPLERVYDKVAFRIIVRTVKECYEALGVVHAAWPPVPGRIKDFIHQPKSNNYRSLHTTVTGPRNHFIEVQIRTEEMDLVAREGVAAHWAYKEGHRASGDDTRLFSELKHLVARLQEVEDPHEFLESVRGELYDPDIYVLTPTGEVRELPRGSSPIDFAYSIHTAVGDHCVGAKVNGKLVSLRHDLQNGDIVEIVTSAGQQPKRAWLPLVKTSRARTRIRQMLRRSDNEKALELGREICERELRKHETTLKKLLRSGHLRLLLKELGCNSLDDMLVKVGGGAITVPQLLGALEPKESPEETQSRRLEENLDRAGRKAEAPAGQGGIRIAGVDDMLVHVSRCCMPLPGDEAVGLITTGRGVSVHRRDCANLTATDPRRWLEVDWAGSGARHRAALQVQAESSRTILAEISSTINADDVGILEFKASTTPNQRISLGLVVEVSDLAQLQRLQRHLLQQGGIISVRRS
ncbi:MAG: GTP pyrophosphokinase [Desulfobulbaceae bacterium A2]|nr:MAG: GTP pyrophosphokinase [Desulfobulbaceae bacterium A2]